MKITVINWLIINIKYYIHIMKIQKRKLNLPALQNIIKTKIETERCIIFKSGNNHVVDKYGEWFNLKAQIQITRDILGRKKMFYLTAQHTFIWLYGISI